ncbi:zinc finger protein OZF-like [Protopterus annectens]|uniref:zinc finger protein OZF-like n=1 Tax=Protopterus annectens TaxID=7888 RepID=UPI001CFC2804|nr:zinc finger protein OZF-like [Protopterus annectens]
MKLKVPQTFKDVAVEFSREEWQMLSKEEKQLHRDVMLQNYEHMLTVGCKVPLEELVVLLDDPGDLPFSIVEENVTSLQPDPCDIPQTVHRSADCEGRQRSLSKDHMNSEGTKSFTDSTAITGHEDVLHRNHQSKYMESDMSFTQKNELKSPLQRHDVKELSKYSNCKQKVTFPFTFKTHVKITHTNKNGFISSQYLNIFRKFSVVKCDKYKDMQVTRQKLFMRGKPYKYGPLAKSLIKKDKSITTQTGERPYNHAVCEKSFLQKNNLSLRENIHKTEDLFKCIPCGKSFSRRGSLTNHERMHRGDKPYKCATCDKGFTWKNNLRKHEGVHSGNKPLTCIQCGKSFARRTSFKNHERIHREYKPYKCTTCGKSFVWKCKLRDHARIHSGEKPYKCSTCGKSFAWKYYIALHMKTHTLDKPHQCNTCGKSFTWKQCIALHKETHTGDKLHKCDACGNSYTHKCTLKAHEKTHINSYTCTTCSKIFRRKDQLKVHERRHTGEKPYECASCDKHFARKDKLIIHERIHSGEKPYQCSICSKNFARKDRLVTHKKIHSEINPVTVPHVA